MAGGLSSRTSPTPRCWCSTCPCCPQFLDPTTTNTGDALLLAYTVAVLGGLWLLVLMFFVTRCASGSANARCRRTLDGVTGTALIGFGAALALES